MCQGKLGFVSRENEEGFGGGREGMAYAEAQRHEKAHHVGGRIQSWMVKRLGCNGRMFINKQGKDYKEPGTLH